MSPRRLSVIALADLRTAWRRPLVWVLLIILFLMMWGLASGQVRIESGDATVGGKKALITSAFAVAMTFSIVISLVYSFFLTIAAGMAIIRDDELKVGEILHSTPLRPSEYIWGKFLAVLLTFLGVLGLHVLFTILVNHVIPSPGNEEYRGPFEVANYVVPALVFGLPIVVFFAGAAFFIGERSRRPILIFFLPVAFVLVGGFFLWNWSPSWLDPRINQAFMLIDPAGFRWLNETWLKLDRGVAFYNTAPIGFDAPFLLSRLALVVAGIALVFLSQRHFAAQFRASRASTGAARSAWTFGAGERTTSAVRGDADSDLLSTPRPLASLRMKSAPPRFLASAFEVARIELREMRSHPGLYLFVPLILVQTLGSSLLALGAFDTPVLLTPGTLAVRTMNTLTLLICLLLLFYQTESLQRERSTGLGSIYYASPTRTLAMLLGKTLANSVMASSILVATFLGCAIALLVQGKVHLAVWPFILVWGALLLPTFLVWCAFSGFLFALTRNRYSTYAIALAALCLTGYLQFRGKMSWTWNWDIWDTLLWSDMGIFELNRRALLLNRAMVIGLGALFLVLAVRLFPRRDLDASRVVHRLGPPALLKGALRLSPLAAVPLLAGGALWVQVHQGFQGKSIEKKLKDYWKQNLATWKDAPLPGLKAVELDLTLDPERRWFRAEGSYELVNEKEAPLARFPLTGGPYWEDVTWTVDGKDAHPENRTGLYVFTPAAPLAKGDAIRIGFKYTGTMPKGITKNGRGSSEFILPSGVVLTSFTPSFVPLVGYQEDIGVEEDENRYEPKVYPDDFYKGQTDPAFLTGSAFRTKIRITGPDSYTYNSVGALTSEKVEGGQRTVVWESDHPVRFFNVVAGRWKLHKGPHSAVYYHEGHPYNIEEISDGLEAALANYSEWFYPFPWKELKISEFPALAFYAQGFPTNITFSEGIGFLTESEPKTELAFLVTAHESAHQWWGNILMPGKGPGGNILSEGMAHFSTILLMEKAKGERERIEFCRRIEERYGDRRQADSERPLVKIDGSRPGDPTVTYDKGGWAMWMLMNLMGREAALEGLRDFIVKYKDGPDYPVLQDLLETLRGHAPDPAAFDAFVKQWYFEVVVPEYTLSSAKRTKVAAAAGDHAGAAAGSPQNVAENPQAETAHDGTQGTPEDSKPEAPGGEIWEVTVLVKNAGKARMPVEIAAVRGKRFSDDGKPSPDYRDSRTTLELGEGEETTATIRCPFQPEEIVVDPDAKVLQLRRKAAIARL